MTRTILQIVHMRFSVSCYCHQCRESSIGVRV